MTDKTPPPLTGALKSRRSDGAGDAKTSAPAPSKKGQAAYGSKRGER